MQKDIAAVKDSLFDIVDKITKRTEDLEIRFAIVSYRDHPPQDRTYVTRVFDFTSRVKEIHKKISKLKPSEGGDTPEAVADGLHVARAKLSWSHDAYKVLLLVGDAPPHGREYNTLSDDYWPEGCPCGLDGKEELQLLKKDHADSMFIFVCGTNTAVEQSFRILAESVDGGQYYSLFEAHQLPDAILEILEGVSDLIDTDRKVLSYYEAQDGSFDMGEAASEIKMSLRDLKTSLSRLLELGKIPKWPKGRPLGPAQLGLQATFGSIPSAILPGKPFSFPVVVTNPSALIIGIRVIVSLITDEGVSEITNEIHDISPKSDQTLTLTLVPMTDNPGKAKVRVEVFYGSKSLATEVYNTRIYVRS